MDQALLQHILTRLHADIDFLASQSLISQDDASVVRSRLPGPSAAASLTAGGHGLGHQLSGLSLGGGNDLQRGTSSAGAGTLGAGAPSSSLRKQDCRATWDYNATQPDDLQFRKGDIIELIVEENADWWRGRIDGRSGIFPSNYVEKLPPSQPSAQSPYTHNPPTPAPAPSATSYNALAPPAPSQQPQYPYQQPQGYGSQSSFGGHPPPPSHPAQGQWDEKSQYHQPPPQNQYHAPPPPQQQFDQQQQQQVQQVQQQAQPAGAPPIPPKKNQHKFAKLMGTSFAGGVGFGTGTAVAQNAINAIF